MAQKKKREILVESDYYLPLRVLVWTGTDVGRQICYDKNGEPMVDLRRPRRSRGTVPVDNLTFSTLVSINTFDDVQEFFRDHPNIHYAFAGDPYLKLPEFESRRQYYRRMCRSIYLYNKICNYVYHLKEYQTEPSDDELERTIDAFEEIYRYVRDVNPHRDSHANTLVRNRHELGTNTENGINIERRSVNEELLNISIQQVQAYISNICEGVSFQLNLQDIIMDCICPNLYSAMYMLIYVVLSRDYSFRLCKAKNCNRFFAVRSTSKQTLCPMHAARRKATRDKSEARCAARDEGRDYDD